MTFYVIPSLAAAADQQAQKAPGQGGVARVLEAFGRVHAAEQAADDVERPTAGRTGRSRNKCSGVRRIYSVIILIVGVAVWVVCAIQLEALYEVVFFVCLVLPCFA